jgi:hypothetical protein
VPYPLEPCSVSRFDEADPLPLSVSFLFARNASTLHQDEDDMINEEDHVHGANGDDVQDVEGGDDVRFFS